MVPATEKTDVPALRARSVGYSREGGGGGGWDIGGGGAGFRSSRGTYQGRGRLWGGGGEGLWGEGRRSGRWPEKK